MANLSSRPPSRLRALVALFRDLRRTRPFWGGLWTILAGYWILRVGAAPMPIALNGGWTTAAAYVVGGGLLLCGALAWVIPQRRSAVGIGSFALALAAFPTANLGGLLVGSVLGIIGASLTWSWGERRSSRAPSDEVRPVEAERSRFSPISVLKSVQYRPNPSAVESRERTEPWTRRAQDWARVRRDNLAVDAGRVRRGARKRGIVMAVVGFVGIGGMVHLVSMNVMAVNFTSMNSKFKLYTNYLEAQEVASFMGPGTQQATGSRVAVADLGAKVVNMVGVCILVNESIAGVPTSFKITSGMKVPDPSAFTGTSLPSGVATKLNAAGQVQQSMTDPDVAHAEFAYLNATSLNAYGHQIMGMYLGETADTVNTHAGIGAWPTSAGGTTPTAGDFGIYGKQFNLGGVSGDTFGLRLQGSTTLPKLDISIVPGTLTQADCS